jgi:hypothetical protein
MEAHWLCITAAEKEILYETWQTEASGSYLAYVKRVG